jgi:SAM-dependent methyltransferase
VVGGVLILDPPGAGPTRAQLIEWVRQGRADLALASLLPARSPELTHRWLRGLPRWPLVRSVQDAAHAAQAAHLVGAAARADREQRHRLSACAYLGLYYRFVPENFYYMSYRYGQPRYLVGVAFASLLRGASDAREAGAAIEAIDTRGAILDVGCGAGHLAFALTEQNPRAPVIGIDTFFFGLWLAQQRIAPDADYICCAADRELPFVDGAFGGVFCCDAFHYFADKPRALAEMLRVSSASGRLLFTGMHNRNVARELAYGLPLTPEGYGELVAPHAWRLFDDREVLEGYFRGRPPHLERSSARESLRTARLLSLVVTRQPGRLEDPGSFTRWPHAVGTPRLNFLYRLAPSGGGGRWVRREPSRRFVADNPEIEALYPASVEATAEALEALREGRWSPALDAALDRAVVVGMPAAYGSAEDFSLGWNSRRAD